MIYAWRQYRSGCKLCWIVYGALWHTFYCCMDYQHSWGHRLGSYLRIHSNATHIPYIQLVELLMKNTEIFYQQDKLGRILETRNPGGRSHWESYVLYSANDLEMPHTSEPKNSLLSKSTPNRVFPLLPFLTWWKCYCPTNICCHKNREIVLMSFCSDRFRVSQFVETS